MSQRKLIYMDHSATTPVHADVVAAMLPYWTEDYGNPSSQHYFGRQAQNGLETARQTIARLLNAKAKEIIFTGCGSESDNLAVRGVMFAARNAGRGNHFITSCIEHPAILETGRQLVEQFGFEMTVLPVDGLGRVQPAELKKAIRPDTALVSIMAANNEIGTIQPIEELGRLARDNGALFHTDAVQAAGYRRWNLAELPIDLLSMAPHKFYGPKGVGILYVRDGVELLPALTGGGQENGQRPGTVNVPFAVGAAAAFALAMRDLEANVVHCQAVRDRLIERVLTQVPAGCLLTGDPVERLPHHVSFAFEDLSGNDLIINLDMQGLAASSGSACSTGNPKPSATLEALGLDPRYTLGGLRLTVGLQNSLDDAERAAEIVTGAVASLRQFRAALAG
ncbi:MAG: cysteine desulfurase [Ardenticatenales bacterium]|nr:cysteine desulfurase [Ardenticatenales bacterium]